MADGTLGTENYDAKVDQDAGSDKKTFHPVASSKADRRKSNVNAFCFERLKKT
jgi:hypothetical protein